MIFSKVREIPGIEEVITHLDENTKGFCLKVSSFLRDFPEEQELVVDFYINPDQEYCATVGTYLSSEPFDSYIVRLKHRVTDEQLKHLARHCFGGGSAY